MEAQLFIGKALKRLSEVTNNPKKYADVRSEIMAGAGQALDIGIDVQEVSDAIPDNVEQFLRMAEPPLTTLRFSMRQ
jgi:hypothetical protein